MSRVKENAKRVAIVLAVLGFTFSSVGITVLYFLENKKQQSDLQQQQEILKQLQQQQEETVREPLEGHSAEPFNASEITELSVMVLQEGDGTAATAESTVSANYFGWTSDGKIFDSTNKGGTATPIDFPLSGVIEGWTKGLTGIRAGSVVKLSIPGDMAYGNEDDGSGRPFGPLMFIVELKEVK